MLKVKNWIVKIYRDDEGRELIVEWIESIKDITVKARIKNRIRRMEIGNFGDCKSVGAGIFELRLNFGSGYRVYFGKVDNKIILLLIGGNKKTQSKDIKRANEFWKRYKIKNKHNGKNKKF